MLYLQCSPDLMKTIVKMSKLMFPYNNFGFYFSGWSQPQDDQSIPMFARRDYQGIWGET